ncbi:MAG: hypothetical protein EA401_09600 [Planctomycetota bacterium]|nr:MAG: hypothetical protein EA401_09600 [Planctomycetota bacterium]
MTAVILRLFHIASALLILTALLLWPALAAVGTTVSLPWALLVCLLVSGLGFTLVVVDMLRRGRRDQVWLSLLIAGVIGSLPVTVFAFSGDSRFTLHMMVVIALTVLWLIYLLNGLRAGGLQLLAATLSLAALLASLPLAQGYLGMLSESQDERLEAQERELAYQEARRVLDGRLAEVEAPPQQRDIERRLDLQGLPQVRANALRERLRTVAEYEADYSVPVEQTFERGAAGRFRNWRAPEGGDYRSQGPVQRDQSRIETADSAAGVLAAASEQEVAQSEDNVERLELAPGLYMRALRVGALSEALAVASAMGVVMLLLVHYIAQLNALFPRIAAFPILGPWSDGVHRVERCVRLDSDNPQALVFAVSEAVRKGEQALVLGSVPLPNAFPRYKIGRFALPFHQLRVLDDASKGFRKDSSFCWEQVWFGRYLVQIQDHALSRAMLLDLVDILRLRQQTKARARHLVNIIWYHEEPPPQSLVEEMSYLSHVLNLRFIVAGAAYEDEDESLYDSWYDDAHFAPVAKG